jgi:hypothetical protein
MHSATKLLAIVLGGFAVGACGGSTTSPPLGQGDEPGADGGTDGSTGSSDGSPSTGGDGGSPSGSDSGPSSGQDSGSAPSGPSGYAIPLSSPDGPDYEYTASATIGSQSFALSIDTGSTTLGVGGTGCTTCTGVTPLYAPSSTATATGKRGDSEYADGTGWSGPVYTDAVTLGDGSPSVSLEIVDITKATGQQGDSFFDGSNDYQGILGLGPSQNAVQNTTGYMPVLMSGGVTNTFAFELCDTTGPNAGTMWLGGDGSPGSSVVYTPLLAISDQNSFYAIDVDGMSLGGTTIVSNAASTFAQPVLDTGTSLFYVPTSVFNTFQTTLEASSGFTALFGSNTFATTGDAAGCVTDASVTDAQVEAMLPAISLSLPGTGGGADVTIQASALDTYLYDGGNGQFCLAIQDGGTQDPSTFGDAFMQGFHIVVDVAGNRVGFAPPSACVQAAIHRNHHPAKTGPHRGPRASHR